MTFGERLREVRERRGLSQNALAERAGVSRQLVFYLESGQRQSPTVDNAKKLARVLNVSIDYLAGTYEGEDQDTELQPAVA